MKHQYEFYKKISLLIIICGGLGMMYGGYSLGNVITAERIMIDFLNEIDYIPIQEDSDDELQISFLLLKIFAVIPIIIGIGMLIIGYKINLEWAINE